MIPQAISKFKKLVLKNIEKILFTDLKFFPEFPIVSSFVSASAIRSPLCESKLLLPPSFWGHAWKAAETISRPRAAGSAKLKSAQDQSASRSCSPLVLSKYDRMHERLLKYVRRGTAIKSGAAYIPEIFRLQQRMARQNSRPFSLLLQQSSYLKALILRPHRRERNVR
nr:hypothetical protein [uncultured Oscillibacter sp.]